MERIHISGLELYAFHGCNTEEREYGQVFWLDLIMGFDATAACSSDDLMQTLNYAKAVKVAAAAFCSGPYQLIERAARVTADALLGEFPQLKTLTVRVHKPDAPISKYPVADIIFELECRKDGIEYE
jgi:dihydroneopterin aldolase